MKVREIEMILADMGAIDPENPEESLGKIRSLEIYSNSLLFSSSDSNAHKLQRTLTE